MAAAQSRNENISLNDVLNTPALKTELAAIVALLSDYMRRQLLAYFEPVRVGSTPKEDDVPGLIDPSDAVNASTPRNNSRDPVESSQIQGLRNAAVTYFDKWQIDVLRRLGEVLQVRPDAVRKARANAKAQAEAAAKVRRDKAYYDWAEGLDQSVEDHADDTSEGMLPEGFDARILHFPQDRRIIILNSVLLLVLSLEQYTAHSRVLMAHLTTVLRLPQSTLTQNESKIAEGLLATAAASMSADASTTRQAAVDASARRWKVGLATVAGAALIGITGGIAAPILAASLGGIMGTLGLGAVASLLGPLATNVLLVGGLFGAYGGRMTGQIMEKYAQEIRDFKFLPVSTQLAQQVEGQRAASDEDAGIEQLQLSDVRNAHKLRVVIGISGSALDAEDFVRPWDVFSTSRIEAFGLRWEMDALLQLGKKMLEVLTSYAWDFAKYKLASLLLAGLWPFGLLRAARSLDSPFAIAKIRSDKAGKVLADALVQRVQGARPVTLVGYGLGSRVIHSCLLELGRRNAFGLVESAVFMGAPVSSESSYWRRIRAMVSGRVVNVFSADDFLLGFLYRAHSVEAGIAGVNNIRGVHGVENYDFTDMVKGHDNYRFLTGKILQRIGFADLDNDAIQQQEVVLREREEQRRKDRKAVSAAAQGPADESLAKEDANGQITLLNGEQVSLGRELQPEMSETGSQLVDTSPSQAMRPDLDDDDEPHTIQMVENDEPLTVLDPLSEPDYGLDRENVRFGGDQRGFDVRWDRSDSLI
jgi:hypothetical protein